MITHLENQISIDKSQREERLNQRPASLSPVIPSKQVLMERGGARKRTKFSAKPETERANFAPTIGQANKSARGMPWH